MRVAIAVFCLAASGAGAAPTLESLAAGQAKALAGAAASAKESVKESREHLLGVLYTRLWTLQDEAIVLEEALVLERPAFANQLQVARNRLGGYSTHRCELKTGGHKETTWCYVTDPRKMTDNEAFTAIVQGRFLAPDVVDTDPQLTELALKLHLKARRLASVRKSAADLEKRIERLERLLK